MNREGDLFHWYYEIPVVSRTYLTAAVLLTLACFAEIVSPLSLYYTYDLVVNKGQYWRLLSSFFFFGTVSIDFLFHLYFVTRYCRLLEEGIFRGRTADFVFMLIIGMVLMVITATTIPMFAKIKFLGHPLAFMMVYIWGRSPENAHVRMGFLGIFPFTAPYLPWVLLLFSMFLGNPIEIDLLGIVIGHIYYFLEFVYPKVAAIRGWSLKKILYTPPILNYMIGNGYVGEEAVMIAEMEREINAAEDVAEQEAERVNENNLNQFPDANANEVHAHQD